MCEQLTIEVVTGKSSLGLHPHERGRDFGLFGFLEKVLDPVFNEFGIDLLFFVFVLVADSANACSGEGG